MSICLFIFRRDYRLFDNTGLYNCMQNNDYVQPIFIFTPEQIQNNPYKSNNAVQFMVESLVEMQKAIQKFDGKLLFLYGDNITVLKEILQNNNIKSVCFNRDYTPYSQKRDGDIEQLCKFLNIKLEIYEDYLLLPIGTVITNQGQFYSKFTNYYNKAVQYQIETPKIIQKYKFYNKPLKSKYIISHKQLEKFYDYNKNASHIGGRDYGITQLMRVKQFQNYNENRNNLSIQNTQLSPYIRFGNISIREVYYRCRKYLSSDNQLIQQLYWYSFYQELGYYNPDIYTKRYIIKSFKHILWDKNEELFFKWRNGITGFPISDAGMRQMNKTGFMHNRARMLSATLLSRVLLIDWRLGEQYFSRHLIDHFRPSNDGNWFWVVGTSSHSQPYFRVMNEWDQIKAHDYDCIYIKQWIPQLHNVPANDIRKWYLYYHSYSVDYPGPIVDYKNNKSISLARYNKSKSMHNK